MRNGTSNENPNRDRNSLIAAKGDTAFDDAWPAAYDARPCPSVSNVSTRFMNAKFPPTKVAVLGSINMDLVIGCLHLPRPGETVLGESSEEVCGGKGANQAVAAARSGGQVTFIARVGNDLFGEQAIRGFGDDGINLDNIIIDETSPSGVALIFVGNDGENSIAVATFF